MPKVLVPLAPGFEEIEAITIIDVLRRAGVTVVTAGLIEGPIEASRKTRHLADVSLSSISMHDGFDMLILPGGQPGTDHLLADGRISSLVEQFAAAGKWLGAICAAPSVLAKAGLLNGRPYVCHPTADGLLHSVRPSGDIPMRESHSRVVVHDRIITSLSAGSAMEFAFGVVEKLCGREQVLNIQNGILAPTA